MHLSLEDVWQQIRALPVHHLSKQPEVQAKARSDCIQCIQVHGKQGSTAHVVFYPSYNYKTFEEHSSNLGSALELLLYLYPVEFCRQPHHGPETRRASSQILPSLASFSTELLSLVCAGLVAESQTHTLACFLSAFRIKPLETSGRWLLQLLAAELSSSRVPAAFVV